MAALYGHKPRKVQELVIKALQQGCILTTTKTKSLADGGKQTITVGPRRVAVQDGYAYQAIYWRGKNGQEEQQYRLAYDAAKDFIAFVGRDHAYRAALWALGKGK